MRSPSFKTIAWILSAISAAAYLALLLTYSHHRETVTLSFRGWQTNNLEEVYMLVAVSNAGPQTVQISPGLQVRQGVQWIDSSGSVDQWSMAWFDGIVKPGHEQMVSVFRPP